VIFLYREVFDLENILKLLRQEKKITQKELATILNLSPSTIAMYETGKRKPDSDTLKLLADYFDVSVDYLLGRTSKKNVEVDNEIVTKAFSLKEGVTELPQEALDQIDEYIRLMKLKYKDKK
jgi:transcriptional regulator with XRE-family HTH domain